MKHRIFISLLSLFSLYRTFAQCTVTTVNDIITTCPNTSVTVGVYPYSTGVFNTLYNFNNSIPPGWQTTGATTFGTPCGNSIDGTPYYWASTSVGVPSITTSPINTSCGGEIRFDLMYAVQGGTSPCEGPDQMNEGVLLQYSVNNGANWTDIVYFVPDGTTAPHINNSAVPAATGPTPFTQWNTFTYPLPYNAISSSTLFRWIQPNSSGSCCDNWGLDNIKFNDNNCANNIITWENGSTQNNITVTPASDTTLYFEVFDSLGILQCTDSVFIDVLSPGFDNLVNLVSANFMPGQQAYTTIHAENLGCQNTSGTISLVLDPLTSFVSAVPAPNSINGDTLYWNYTNLSQPSGNSFIANITLLTSTSAQVGDSVYLDLKINDLIGDAHPGNNIRNYRFPVLNGYDPNDKKVYPSGDCTPHFVYNDEKLTYTIRFRNTGNSYAYNIKLIDSLNPNIKKESLRILGSSHPVKVHFDNNDVLRFNFDTILLPASISVGPYLSTGYVIFEFEQKPNLAHGVVIKNKARIYFDYNPAIITNQVFNTVTDGSHISESDTLVVFALDSTIWNNQTYTQSGIYSYHSLNQYGCDSVSYLNLNITSLGLPAYSFDFSIHPNPSNGKITIQTTNNEEFALKVSGLDGKSVFTSKISGSSEIDLGYLAPGTYLVSCTLNGSEITKRIVIK